MASIDSGTASVVSVIKSAPSLSYDDKLKFKQAGRPTPVIAFEGPRQCRYVLNVNQNNSIDIDTHGPWSDDLALHLAGEGGLDLHTIQFAMCCLAM